MNNLDIGLELQKIRGGWIFNDINMHMNIKLDCMNNKHLSKCKWVNGLKYYVYSADFGLAYSLFLQFLRRNTHWQMQMCAAINKTNIG
ncbi:hypothetical protein Y032_0329g2670 [Ancylostoma ceylanicum]|uniref:Uncharacterized protein n=1 Tax=Ancylostoma ceylanicum TaxID=53326 RepID=A0A016S0K3_9BILA|nr:hypothetical protein Y032_0329g2670 [Ancylostoma ceylanicum]